MFDKNEGMLYKNPSDIKPSSPITGLSNPACWMYPYNDCSSKISREHYVSKSTLIQVGDSIDVSGTRWLEKRSSARIRVKRLVAKNLCERHNKAFEPLDRETSSFFRALLSISGLSNSEKHSKYLISGDDIQRWMYKTLFGLVTSKSMQGPEGELILPGCQTRDDLDMLFDPVKQNDEIGMYVFSEPGTSFTSTKSVVVAPLLDKIRGTLIGMEVRLASFAFLVTTVRWLRIEGGILRPSVLYFSRGKELISSIVLSWIGHHSDDVVEFKAGDQHEIYEY